MNTIIITAFMAIAYFLAFRIAVKVTTKQAIIASIFFVALTYFSAFIVELIAGIFLALIAGIF